MCFAKEMSTAPSFPFSVSAAPFRERRYSVSAARAGTVSEIRSYLTLRADLFSRRTTVGKRSTVRASNSSTSRNRRKSTLY